MEQQNLPAPKKSDSITQKLPPKSLAISETVKAHQTGLTIRAIDVDELTDSLKALLIIICETNAIKLDKIHIQNASAFICKYFKDFTLEEIKLAFEYFNARKLKTPENFGHYGVLSPDFIGGVLKGFRELRIEDTRKDQLKVGTLDTAQTAIMTEEEKEEINRRAMLEGAAETFAKLKSEDETQKADARQMLEGLGHLYYDHLRAIGVMKKPSKELESHTKAKASQQIKNEIRARQQNTERGGFKFKELAEALNNVTKSPNFINKCKKIALTEYFDDLILAGVDLQKLITDHETKNN